MAHDHHFLERLDRVERDQLEYALALYRNHEAVRYVLDHIDAPAERVALAIGSVKRGPYVVVATNGAFVTCLGEGMSPGPWPVVPRDRLDALIARHKELRTREQIAEDLRREGENDREFFTRIFDRANAMCRDEFLALAAFAPLFARKYFAAAALVSIELFTELGSLAKVSKIKPQDLPFAKGLYRSFWFGAHAILLSTMGEREALNIEATTIQGGGLTLTGSITVLGSMTHMLRSAWAAAQIGELLVAGYAAHMKRRPMIDVWLLDDVACLGAIAVAHEELKPRIVSILTEAAEAIGDDDVENKPIRLLMEMMVGFIGAPDEATNHALGYGRFLYTVMCAGLPESDPHFFSDPEKVPEDLAKTALLAFDGDVMNHSEFKVIGLAAIPMVARAKAEEFYFEREVARKVCPEWTPDVTVDLVQRHVKAGHVGGITVTAEAKQGRNEPCACGSGKKYKKCHGA